MMKANFNSLFEELGMRFAYLFVLGFMFVGCGKTNPPTIDPSAQPYVDEWNALYTDHAVTVDVVIGNLPINVMGQWDGIQVVLSSFYWKTLLAPVQQQIVFHELGHAMFGYGHDWGYVVKTDVYGRQVNIERSIMYPYAFGDEVSYTEFLSYYENQLGSCTTCTSLVNGNVSTSRGQVSNGLRID